jgi:hypothetical protein
MIVGQGAAHLEQRAASEILEIEGGARRIAEGPAGQAIIDAAAAIEMAQERDRIPSEPRPRARDGGQDRQAEYAEHRA